MNRKRGIALAVIITLLVVVFVSAFGVFKLMRGVGSQVEYSDAHIRALNIAESGFQVLAARFMSRPYEDRWFRDHSDAKAGLKLEGGTWDYYIEDTPGQPMNADAWVRGEYKNTKRLLFYRFRYEDRLFRGLTAPTQKFAGSTEDSEPVSLEPGNVSGLTKAMNEMIAKRESNRSRMMQKWDELAEKMDPVEILRTLGAEVGEGVPDVSVPGEDPDPTTPPTPSKIKLSAGARHTLKNIEDPEKLLGFFVKEAGFGPRFTQAFLTPLVAETVGLIEVLCSFEQYVAAEKIYLEFLKCLYSVKSTMSIYSIYYELILFKILAKLVIEYKGKNFDDLKARARLERARILTIAPADASESAILLLPPEYRNLPPVDR